MAINNETVKNVNLQHFGYKPLLKTKKNLKVKLEWGVGVACF